MEKFNNFASINFTSILGHTHIINRGKQNFTMTFKVRGQGHNVLVERYGFVYIPQHNQQ